MKTNKITAPKIIIPPLNLAMEAPAIYYTNKKITASTSYAYSKFAKLQEKLPLSLKEWATILHISERTLQRYAQHQTNFEGLHVERLQDIEELITLGLQAFKNGNALYAWLQQPKQVYNYTLNFDSLTNSKGIQLLTQQIGRIAHNVYS
jgi:DNA-binding transcriptional regulator YiaG